MPGILVDSSSPFPFDDYSASSADPPFFLHHPTRHGRSSSSSSPFSSLPYHSSLSSFHGDLAGSDQNLCDGSSSSSLLHPHPHPHHLHHRLSNLGLNSAYDHELSYGGDQSPSFSYGGDPSPSFSYGGDQSPSFRYGGAMSSESSPTAMASSLALWAGEMAALQRFLPSNRGAEKEIEEEEEWGSYAIAAAASAEYAEEEDDAIAAATAEYTEDAIAAASAYASPSPSPSQSPSPSPFLQAMADAYSCDDFRMYEFKVRRCVRGRSHDWTECPFAHPGEKARRRDPRRFHYSGSACPDYRKGLCRRGDSCEYSHGVFECWLHPARYRTQPCKDGSSCTRKICFFAHSIDQLRLLPSPAIATPSSSSSSSSSPSSSPSSSSADSFSANPVPYAEEEANQWLCRASASSSSASPPSSPLCSNPQKASSFSDDGPASPSLQSTNPSAMSSRNPNPSAMSSRNPNPSDKSYRNPNPSDKSYRNPNPSGMSCSMNPNSSGMISRNPKNPSVMSSMNPKNPSVMSSMNPKNPSVMGSAWLPDDGPNPSFLPSLSRSPPIKLLLQKLIDHSSCHSSSSSTPTSTLSPPLSPSSSSASPPMSPDTSIFMPNSRCSFSHLQNHSSPLSAQIYHHGYDSCHSPVPAQHRLHLNRLQSLPTLTVPRSASTDLVTESSVGNLDLDYHTANSPVCAKNSSSSVPSSSPSLQRSTSELVNYLQNLQMRSQAMSEIQRINGGSLPSSPQMMVKSEYNSSAQRWGNCNGLSLPTQQQSSSVSQGFFCNSKSHPGASSAIAHLHQAETDSVLNHVGGVQSGRDFRADFYGKIGKENGVGNDEDPDLGWVSELVM